MNWTAFSLGLVACVFAFALGVVVGPTIAPERSADMDRQAISHSVTILEARVETLEARADALERQVFADAGQDDDGGP